MMVRRAIRVGVVGVGFGQQVHVPALRRDDRCRVMAICAQHVERAQAAAQRLQIPKAYGDWRALVADPEIDAVAIAVPPSAQPAIARAALQQRKHLLCEKPLAMTSDAAHTLWAAAHDAGVAHMVDFEFLMVDAWQHARAIIVSGALGPVRHATVSWQVETQTNRAGVLSWKTDTAAGGGALNMFGSHVFAYLEWLLGPVQRVSARLWNRVDHRPPDAYDTLAGVSLVTADRVPVTATISTHALQGTGHRIELYGEHGRLVLENTTPDYLRGFTLTSSTRAQPVAATVCAGSTGDGDGRIEAVGAVARAWCDWMIDGIEQRPTFAEGCRVQRLLEAARESHAAGTWIDVTPAEAPSAQCLQS